MYKSFLTLNIYYITNLSEIMENDITMATQCIVLETVLDVEVSYVL